MFQVLELPPKGHFRVVMERTVMGLHQIRDFYIKGMVASSVRGVTLVGWQLWLGNTTA